MTSFARARLAALAVAALAAGCNDPYSPEGLCVAQSEAMCRYQFRCCTAYERADQFPVSAFFAYDDEATCIEELQKVFCATNAPLVESVREGRISWDRESAQTCFEAGLQAVEQCDAQTLFKTGSFSLTDAQNDACAEIQDGLVDDGDACFADAECKTPGAVCVTRTSDDPNEPLLTSEGTCEAPPDEGDACPAGICQEGLYCDGTCQRLKAVGAECDGADECESGRCDFANFPAVCAAKLENGQNCFSDGECASGFCNDDFQCAAAPAGPEIEFDVQVCDGVTDEG